MISTIIILWLYVWGFVASYVELDDRSLFPQSRGQYWLGVGICVLWPVLLPVAHLCEYMGWFDD